MFSDEFERDDSDAMAGSEGGTTDAGATGEVPDLLSVQPQGPVTVTFDPMDGTTSLVFQLMARDGAGVPLTDDDVRVELFVRPAHIPGAGVPVDPESVLDQSSEALATNLMLGLVLDSSYSMLIHDPPAFKPMLSAVRGTIEEGEDLWKENAGSFQWQVFGFDEFVHQATDSEGAWKAKDVSDIPNELRRQRARRPVPLETRIGRATRGTSARGR